MSSWSRRRFLQAAGGLAAMAAGAELLRSSTPMTPTPAPPLPPLPDPAAAPLPPAAPADPHASADTRALLNWLRGLRARTTQRVVSGQQINADAQASYQQYVADLAARSGKWVAMVGAGYNVLWTPEIPAVLTEHWRAGGLVTMEFHASNPWNPAPGVSSAWVDINAPKPDLTQLLSGARPSAQRSQWRAQLAGLGDAIEGLSESGVVVLLRPFFENNGSWFWWGQDLRTRKTALVALYRDLFGYICEDRDLHNVLWLHSPCDSWDGPMMQYYPGTDYIDVIAPTCYDDQLLLLGDRPGQRDHHDYRDILAAGKPLGFGECGPDKSTNGTWDARTITNRIRTNYPAMSYFDCWAGWDSTIMQLVDDQHADELLHDPLVITRDTVDWRAR